MTDKDSARQESKRRLASLDAARLEAVSAGVVRALDEAIVQREGVSSVAGFVAKGPEPNLRGLFDRLMARGVAVAFPRVTGPGTMAFHRMLDWDGLVDGVYGLREPPESWPVITPHSLDLVLVPGLAFAADGSRLGHGGGYYDRMLVSVERGRRWGVCAREVLVAAPAWPVEAHDMPVGRVFSA